MPGIVHSSEGYPMVSPSLKLLSSIQNNMGIKLIFVLKATPYVLDYPTARKDYLIVQDSNGDCSTTHLERPPRPTPTTPVQPLQWLGWGGTDAA